MDIEKTLTIAAPPARVWELLLDPNVMGDCVPGMQSIDVLSDTEYDARMHVRIAFVSAKFKIRTTIVEQRAPYYLRTEGSGDDASVASSFRQTSEMFLDELPDGQTSVRMKVTVDVLGRLGTFGLNVMKTKADRMWDEFGVNLAARVAPPREIAAGAPPQGVPVGEPAVVAAPNGSAGPAAGAPLPAAAAPRPPLPQRPGWFARMFGTPQVPREGAAVLLQRRPDDICIEVRRGDATVTVLWPAQNAAECATWLREYLGPARP
jgi:carbon monoxide dehydrogenase subunit G